MAKKSRKQTNEAGKRPASKFTIAKIDGASPLERIMYGFRE